MKLLGCCIIACSFINSNTSSLFVLYIFFLSLTVDAISLLDDLLDAL